MGSNDIAVEIVGRVESVTTTVKLVGSLGTSVGANARATADDILSFLGAICVPAWMGVNFAVMRF